MQNYKSCGWEKAKLLLEYFFQGTTENEMAWLLF